MGVITLMGVAGCGKTAVGEELAAAIGWEFIESDDYHSKADIVKMSTGIPLTDADRWPWLERLNTLLVDKQEKNMDVVLACSALKQTYREVLYQNIRNGKYVYLKGSYDLIIERMSRREHFMKPSMLQSQFDVLEEPIDALVIDIQAPIPSIVNKIITTLQLQRKK